MNFIKKIISKIILFFSRLQIYLIYQFKLKPKLLKIKNYINKIIELKSTKFPIGKSVLVFPGSEDTIYFIIFKDIDSIYVLEIYDDFLNKIPSHYDILQRIYFNEILS